MGAETGILMLVIMALIAMVVLAVLAGIIVLVVVLMRRSKKPSTGASLNGGPTSANGPATGSANGPGQGRSPLSPEAGQGQSQSLPPRG